MIGPRTINMNLLEQKEKIAPKKIVTYCENYTDSFSLCLQFFNAMYTRASSIYAYYMHN